MAWAIWTIKNEWIFNNKDPSIERCKQKFIKEFRFSTTRIPPLKDVSKSSLKNSDLCC
jgi:hypothetical protein